MDEVRNTWNDGPGSAIYVSDGGTLSGTLGGVPLEFIAVALGLTLTITGTGATAVKSLAIPPGLATPLLAARWRQLMGDANGEDQTVRYDGVRSPPAMTLGATEREWTNASFEASVSGLAEAGKYVTIEQRATASSFSA